MGNGVSMCSVASLLLHLLAPEPSQPPTRAYKTRKMNPPLPRHNVYRSRLSYRTHARTQQTKPENLSLVTVARNRWQRTPGHRLWHHR